MLMALRKPQLEIWELLEEEKNHAELEGDGLVIQMDGIVHAGPALIKDPNKQNGNGLLFGEFL